MFNSVLIEGQSPLDPYYPSDGLLGNNVEPTFIANDNGMGFGTWYHNISDDGRFVFFETGASLLPEDVNGKTDVYELHDGKLGMVSPGNGSYNSYYLGASRDGSSVLFATRDDLVSQDGDGQLDVYAARIGGGFPPLAQPASCSGEACQGESVAMPSGLSVGTVTFTGSGNAPTASSPSTRARKALVSAPTTVKGSSFTLSVKAPGTGRITASGSGLRSASRSVAKAATYHLTIALTARAKRSLNRRHHLNVTVRVRYAPTGGPSSTTTVPVTLKA
jgi:hypothetical protein